MFSLERSRRRDGSTLPHRPQSLTVPSLLPDSTYRPHGEKATLGPLPVCPPNRRSCRPVRESQSRTASSLPPETARAPSGEKATPLTLSVCPSRHPTSCPDSISHSRIVQSRLEDRACR